MMVAAGCASHAKTGDAQAKAVKHSTDRPETEGAVGPAAEKATLSSAATDLQSLFDQIKNDPASGASTGRDRSAASDSKPDANVASALDSSNALNSIKVPPKAKSGKARPTSGDDADADDTISLARNVAGDRPDAIPSGVRLGTVALCQRVDGFGRFTPLSNNRFIAGRSAAMILYAEVLNFSQRDELIGESTVDTVHVVELSQEVNLLLDSDGSLQFIKPEQTLRDASRTPRKDFFVVQRIDLPPNLSVGKYNLKLTLRDKGSGAEAERIIPILIVADPAIAWATENGAISPDSNARKDPSQTPLKKLYPVR